MKYKATHTNTTHPPWQRAEEKENVNRKILRNDDSAIIQAWIHTRIEIKLEFQYWREFFSLELMAEAKSHLWNATWSVGRSHSYRVYTSSILRTFMHITIQSVPMKGITSIQKQRFLSLKHIIIQTHTNYSRYEQAQLCEWVCAQVFIQFMLIDN